MKKRYSKEEFKRLNYEIFIWLITGLSVLNVILLLALFGIQSCYQSFPK